MSVNIFFSNCLMGTISASIVAKKMHPGDVNVLCVEQAVNYFTKGYYDLNSILEKYFPWNKILHVEREEYSSPARDSLIKYIRSIWKIARYYRSFGKKINKQIADLGHIDNIYACMPTRFWCLVGDKKTKLNIIEHSIQEYNMLWAMNQQHYPISKGKVLLDKIMGYKQMIRCIPSRFVLLDGGRSTLLQNLEPIRVPYISMEAREDVYSIAKFFEEGFKKVFPEAYEELEHIRDQMGHFKNRYVYMPTGAVGSDDYGRYIEEQFKDVSWKDTCVLVKCHHSDPRDYSAYFKGHCVVFEPKNRINRILPAEILTVILGMPRLWSSYSSAMIYSYWWHASIPLLSVVNTHPVNAMLQREYKNFVNNEFALFQADKMSL